MKRGAEKHVCATNLFDFLSFRLKGIFTFNTSIDRLKREKKRKHKMIGKAK
jgi:hypothetical protein